MQNLNNQYQNLNFLIAKIQNEINSFEHDSLNLNDIEKSIHVDYKNKLNLFVMDSFTRCLNIKKSFDRNQVTTHCAVYFKLNDSFDPEIQRVKKIFITSNKNACKLRKRSKDLFGLIGYEIDDKCFLRKSKTQSEFLNILNFKFSNLNESLNYYLQKLNKKFNVELNSNGKEVFEQWTKCLEDVQTISLKELDEKTKNAFRDSALFYFYLSVFYYFIRDYYCFDKTELVILDPNNTPLYGLHCEMQLVSKYLNEIDCNNNYISISSDCCVLCNLVLKNLELKYNGSKNNMCSSRFWKFPRFSPEIRKHQFERMNRFYAKISNDLNIVYNQLKNRKFITGNKEVGQEIPYSDEWIDSQDIFWKCLLEKKLENFQKDLKKVVDNEKEILNVLNDYKIYFSLGSFNEFLLKLHLNKNINQKMNEIVKFDTNFRINSIIEMYYLKENEICDEHSQENEIKDEQPRTKKRKLENND